MEKDKDLYEVNAELMEKIYNLTLKYREAYDLAEHYKRENEKLCERACENDTKECSVEHKALLEETLNKLEDLINTNELLETENEQLSDKLVVVRKELTEIERKSVGNNAEAIKLEKEVALMKNKVDDLENGNKALREEKSKLEIDLKELQKVLESVESENKSLQMKLAEIEPKYERTLDENIALKIDLSDKNKEFDNARKKLLEASMNDQLVKNAVQVYDKCIATRAPVYPANQSFNPQHLQQITLMHNQIHYLNQQFSAVCQERDALRAQLFASQGQSRTIINGQIQEIHRLNILLDEANHKLWEMTPHQSIDEIAENHKKLQEQLNQIKASIGLNGNVA